MQLDVCKTKTVLANEFIHKSWLTNLQKGKSRQNYVGGVFIAAECGVVLFLFTWIVDIADAKSHKSAFANDNPW